ncbi:MAG TPA: hypothetical protein DCQ51_12420 [Planktothrix sp. UBA8407]|jgi:hypothetical protein|nr:hypothetical protein [Planktothrix sp. UBA8407]
MTIVRLIAPNFSTDTRHREVVFVLEHFIYYERDVYPDGREQIELMCHMGMCITFSKKIYTPESWEKFICQLENHFTEPEHIPDEPKNKPLPYYYD